MERVVQELSVALLTVEWGCKLTRGTEAEELWQIQY